LQKEAKMRQLPDPRAPGSATGVSENLIADLVSTFYERVRRDPLLGPVFNDAVDDWPAHLGRMRDFWSSVTLMSGRYKGKPIPAHAKLRAIEAAHFTHWLALFRETACDVCPPQAAALFIDRAERIAESLQVGVALQRQSISPHALDPILADKPEPAQA
jgi:hemoglobin